MYSQNSGWHPKFRKTKHFENQKKSSFRPINPNNRPYSDHRNGFLKKRQRPHILAGMFANARSSIPASFNSQSWNPSVIRPCSTSPKPIRKFSNFPRAQLSQTWDFSDISGPKEKSVPIGPRVPPLLKKCNSEEEKEAPCSVVKQDIVKAHPEAHVLPWLKKWNSKDGTADKKPKKVDIIEIPDELKHTIERFSALLDRTNAIQPLSLQNHTETTIGTVEKALIAVSIAQVKEKSKERQKSLPVFDLLVDRSDWLMFREEFNDETDHLPQDPFYSHDVVLSDAEECEHEAEQINYLNFDITRKTDQTRNRGNSSNSFLSFLEDSQNMDSQYNFFDSETSKPPKKLRKIGKEEFDDFITSKLGKLESSDVKDPTASEVSIMPSISKNEDILEGCYRAVPSTSTSTQYSPFNFSIFSQQDTSRMSNIPPSKYSFWE